MRYPRLIIAGLRGGSGKTTITLGLIAALSREIKVTPFKKGPDYIDAGWLSAAAKSPCYNLDPYMIGAEQVLASFVNRFAGDIAIIEGNRGLYDGMDVKGSYSTAELSKLLRSPVILVIDCTKITRTAAALVLGAIEFDKEVKIKGVILNQVSSPRHQRITTDSIAHYCGIPVLGAMPRLADNQLPERHMGLVPIYEHAIVDGAIQRLADLAQRHLDIEGILQVAHTHGGLELPYCNVESAKYHKETGHPEDKIRIGVIRDEAFQFYYPENIEELQRAGAEIVFIDALEDASLPRIDCLYIGGGFPETNALRLAENIAFRQDLNKAIESGMPVYAECGGLMFLGQSIKVDDKLYDMAGVLPLSFTMNSRPEAHGYTEAEVVKENPFYPVGTILRGHEFHYSSAIDGADSTSLALKMRRGKGIANRMDGIVYKNCMALYTHIHALGVPLWADNMLKRARQYRDGK